MEGETKGTETWRLRLTELAEMHGGKRALAKKAGVTESLLYKWLAGEHEPGAKAIQKLSDACGVSVDWLIGEAGEAHRLMEKQEGVVASLQTEVEKAIAGEKTTHEISDLSRALESAINALVNLRRNP